jgi:hypothetical protein
MGAWQRVAMDTLKYHLGPLFPILLRPAGGPTRLTAVSGVAFPHCLRLEAFFYPFGKPMLYAHVSDLFQKIPIFFQSSCLKRDILF